MHEDDIIRYIQEVRLVLLKAEKDAQKILWRLIEETGSLIH